MAFILCYIVLHPGIPELSSAAMGEESLGFSGQLTGKAVLLPGMAGTPPATSTSTMFTLA